MNLLKCGLIAYSRVTYVESAAMFAPPPTLIESSQSTQEGSMGE